MVPYECAKSMSCVTGSKKTVVDRFNGATWRCCQLREGPKISFFAALAQGLCRHIEHSGCAAHRAARYTGGKRSALKGAGARGDRSDARITNRARLPCGCRAVGNAVADKGQCDAVVVAGVRWHAGSFPREVRRTARQ
eukprot:s63_g53.t1